MSQCEYAATCELYDAASAVCNKYLARERSYCGRYRNYTRTVMPAFCPSRHNQTFNCPRLMRLGRTCKPCREGAVDLQVKAP